MKKFFVCFALFAALIFAVGCGGGGSNGGNNQNGNSDTGDTVTDDDSDSGDTVSDGDSSDSGHENPDTTPEQPDNGDSTPEQPDDTDTTPDSGDTAPDNGDTTPDNGDSADDTDSSDLTDDADSSDSQSDDDADSDSDPLYGFPICSHDSGTPCIFNAYLVWSAKSSEQMRWSDAVEYCQNLTEGGYDDWRLPSINLLYGGLLQNCEYPQYINDACLGGAKPDGEYSPFGEIGFLWSSTTYGTTEAWGLYFYFGQAQNKSVDERFNVRCVRIATTSVNAECTEIPENAVYNAASEITLTWDWETYWTPSTETTYNEEPSTKECRFKCKENYFWSPSSNKCIKYPCQDNSCNKTLGNICTGQRSCYNASSSMTCPSSENSTYFGQDAQYATLGVCTPQSFTTLLISSQEVVVDNNTGLTWEKSPSTDSYTWDDRDTHCNELNTSNYGGRSNWRVPNPLELLTIVNNSTYNPATNSNFTGMPTNNSTSLWTSNEYKGDTTKAYVFGPSYGDLANAAKTNTYKVLCVSGNALVPSTSDDFTTSSDGEDGEIVTDNRTGLMWTSCGYEMWKDALAICQNLNTQNYAGYTDWRLPNKNELASLLDLGKSSAPYSNFPGDSFVSSSFWSSSTYVKDTTYAWRVSFSSGVVSTKEKSLSSDIYYIDFRCVRNAE